jgi:galactofuranosylgalactofuranosylrhamnosyl-N-acetylglucosaminyl-diphospho-decaprenol beta-1,5/1,6-galactofuranosyltransferase
MNIISRIQFPSTLETSNLYLKCDDGASLNINAKETHVKLNKNSVISFNTYFNSFYETFYAKYTKLESLYYSLKLKGSFKVSLYRELYEQENRELINQQAFENCQTEEVVKISLPDSWRSEKAGRIYIEINCLSEKGLFQEGNIVTDEAPLREVSLGIVSCTFKKEEYIKKTVDAIFKDELLQSKQLKVFIVDNAKTLEQKEFPEENVELIPNRNVGGSGGFTRGLMQALQEDSYSHFLFMDDDIELESESIYRLFPLYEYAKEDFAVSGSMLDLYNKNLLYEAGALYSKCFDGDGGHMSNPFCMLPLKNKLNIEDPKNKNSLLLEEKPDYGAFWFFAFSKNAVDTIGLPMPFFIKIDDVEFGLRITENLGNPIVAFPGIGVWHEPFYAKNPIWDNYYNIRNNLVTHSMRESIQYRDVMLYLTKSFFHSLFVFDYNKAEMLIKGFEDYMEGPSLMDKLDPEKLHATIVGLSKVHKNENVQADNMVEIIPPAKSNSEENQIPIFIKIIALLTLNGHFLPRFLLKKEPITFWITSEYDDWWTKAFTRKQIIFYREGNDGYSTYQHEMHQNVGIKLFFKWIKLILISATKWSSVSLDWRNNFSRLTSTEFWTKYLKLNEQSL